MNANRILTKIAIILVAIAALFGLPLIIIYVYTDVNTKSAWYNVTYYGLQTTLIIIAFGGIIWLLKSIWDSIE